MESTVSTDPAVEAHVVVRYDPGCPSEVFLSYRSVDGQPVLTMTFGDQIPANVALQQARAAVAPRYELPDETAVRS